MVKSSPISGDIHRTIDVDVSGGSLAESQRWMIVIEMHHSESAVMPGMPASRSQDLKRHTITSVQQPIKLSPHYRGAANLARQDMLVEYCPNMQSAISQALLSGHPGLDEAVRYFLRTDLQIGVQH